MTFEMPGGDRVRKDLLKEGSKMKCTKCGAIHRFNVPPYNCPTCGKRTSWTAA